MGKPQDLFWQLLEKEHAKARAYCFRLTGNADEGDDLYQESVLNAYGGFEGLRNEASFRPWLYRIIGNNFRGRFRKPWWKRVISGKDDLAESEWSENPVGQYDAKKCLDFAFRALSAEDRILVTLADLEGWKMRELAELFSRTEGFVKMRLKRAREKMRKRLSSLYSKKEVEQNKGAVNNYAMLQGSSETE